MVYNTFIKETSIVPSQTKKILVYDSKIHEFLEETSRKVFFSISPTLERLRKKIDNLYDNEIPFSRKKYRDIIEGVDELSGRYNNDYRSEYVDNCDIILPEKEILDFYKRWPTSIKDYCYLYLYHLIGISRFSKEERLNGSEIVNILNVLGSVENSYNKPGFYISGIKPNNFTNNKIKIENFNLWLEYEEVDWGDQKPISAFIRGYRDYNSTYLNWYITFRYSKNKYYMSSKNKMNVNDKDVNKLDFWAKKFKMPKRELIKFLDDMYVWCNDG